MTMRRAGGFSLLEVLIAAALGVVVMAAVTQLLAGSKRGHVELVGQARLHEAARHAVEFIARSARGAGYLGCGPAGNLANGLNGTWAQVAEFDVSNPVLGFEGVGSGGSAADWQPSLAALPVAGGAPALRNRNRIVVANLRPLSDVVAFRRAVGTFALVARMTMDADPVIVADAEGVLADGDFAVLAGCRQAALFRITSLRGSGAVTLARSAGGGPLDNRAGASLRAAGVPYGGAAGPQGATVHRVLAEVYFVARGAGENNRGHPVWSLWRRTSPGRAAELVRGVENLQILYGVDLAPGDGVREVHRYVAADAVGAATVRTLHVRLAVTSVDAVTEDDRMLRRTFSRTVALRSR